MNCLQRLFKKKPFNAREELNKIMKKVDDAWLKYDKTPNRINALRLDGMLDITERLVSRLETICQEGDKPI
jgi:hypothetical protein